ncbi:MAG: hypothetical protein DWQ34_19655 [Planctomycetota bacterium]|nr:MAG: hypothetical protein DWQ34_19655 [Planctomycetota bacterium]
MTPPFSGNSRYGDQRRRIRPLIAGALLVFACGCALTGPIGQNGPREVSPGRAARAAEHVSSALQFYHAGEFERALKEVRKARELDPSLASAHELEAMFQADLGDEEGYVDTLRKVIREHPETHHLQRNAGKMLVQAGLREEGLAAMRRAIELAPNDAAAALDLAGIYVDLGDVSAAIDVLSESRQRNPVDADLAVALARLSETTGDWHSASTYYTAALQRQPRNTAWRRQRAKCLYRLEDYQTAAGEFQTCLDADIRCLTTNDRIEYADSCLHTGDYDRAAWLFDEIGTEGAHAREIAALRGVCELRRGNTRAAARIFESALQRWPDDASLTLLLEASRESSSAVIPAAGAAPAGR